MNPLLVITGGTKGIGRAVIEKFMSEGFDIITCARSDKQLESLRQEMEQRFPGKNLFYQTADLSLRQDQDSFLQFIVSKNQPVAVLVNNTGVFMPGQIHNEAEGVLEKTMETNLYSAYHLTRGVLADMIPNQQGHIFTLCSTASIMAYPNGGSYCISKFALLGMTKVLREELKSYNIRVTAILPGATFTDSWQGTELPEERFMGADDIAESIWSAYRLSPRAVVEEILIRPQLGDLD
ncbi:Sepiapterin reductase [Dyadobacter sp. CECT 9275]|uniref:Sepiapterin reductase n=1 Tax=Dyadobacter helix TaxID=2822344 RepID=A0A916N6E2_9BACT|nr:SDR family oxidoreductase [Dyadobacter sp. CECT 9275]CAG5009464.1 Sepiapterin reductase [Dyadobacter sp. CECT 9275]